VLISQSLSHTMYSPALSRNDEITLYQSYSETFKGPIKFTLNETDDLTAHETLAIFKLLMICTYEKFFDIEWYLEKNNLTKHFIITNIP